MSNKTIFTGRELRLRNTTSKLSETEITTNKETVKIKSASFSDNSNSLDKPLTITGDLTVNGNAIISGSVTSENPAIDIVRHLLPEVGVVADSSLLPVRKDGDTGWHVKNTAGPPQKANYYLYGDTNTSNTYTLGDLKFMSLLVNIITGGNMFLFVYTKPQGAGDAGTWYRSRINYGFQTGSTTETGETLLYVGADDLTENPEDIFTNVKRAKLTEEAFSSVGPKDPSEEILTMGIGTDSSAGVNSIDYVLKVFSYKMKHRINSFLFVLDIEYDETQTRALIESYGYQTAGDVNTAITTALIPYETSAQIDARGYLSEAQILAYNWQDEAEVNALIATATADFITEAEVLAFDYQTEGQVDTLIDARAYLTEPEIQALIDGSAPTNHFFEGVLTANLSVNGQDDAFYLNGANGITATEGGGNWNGLTYNIPEEGNYKFSMGLTAENFSHEFKCYLDVLNGASEVQKKYILDWSSNAYGRFSTVSLPTLTAGQKLRAGVYNPDALGRNILGQGSSADRVYEDFEGFAVAPISNSAGASIQGGWSGGAQPYFQNDTTDDETITNALSVVPGSKSWFTGNVQLYNNPGQGSPHTPKLQIESTAPDEATFNANLFGKTYNASFWFYSPSANDGDGSVLKVYNGVYLGNDRTGFNINITKTAGTMTITSFTYAGGAFSPITLDNTLAYDTWHLVEVSINYDAGGNPSNDVYTYTINGGSSQVVNSWPNIWRVDNGFTPVYGTQLSFGEASHLSGWYIDNIEYQIAGGAPEINTHFNIHKIN